jgi:hypothetical protein
LSASSGARRARRIVDRVHIELQASEHIDIGTRWLTICYKHTNSRDVEQCGASFICACVASNL